MVRPYFTATRSPMNARYLHDEDDPPEFFTWVTNEGEQLFPSEMTTTHLHHSLRMLWNHTVTDDKLLLKPFTERAGVRDWSASYRQQAFLSMVDEFSGRLKEMTEAQRADFQYFMGNVEVYLDTLKRIEDANEQDEREAESEWWRET